jgi:uncharacterized repeat protein (TIGR02543 family)
MVYKLQKYIIVTSILDAVCNKGENFTASEKTDQKMRLPNCEHTKIGYHFTGWNDGEKTYTAGEDYPVPAGGAIFTAQWKANAYTDGRK